MRFILGAAEAGFFPGVVLYLTYWLPSQYRARILATFTVSIPLATFVGSPLSVSMLALDGARPARLAVALRSSGFAYRAAWHCVPVRVDRQAGASVLADGRTAGMVDRTPG